MGPDCGTAVVGGVGARLRQRRRARAGRHRRRLRHRRPAGLLPARRTPGSASATASASAAATCPPTVGGPLHPARRSRARRRPGHRADRLVSKPPAPEVAGRDRGRTPRRWARRSLLALLGPGEPDLTAAAERACSRPAAAPARTAWPALARRRDRRRRAGGVLRGLFCGGTLCDEAMLIAAAALGAGPLQHPAAARAARSAPTCAPTAHTFVDFGDDALTAGRAHPMIDPTLRLERLAPRGRRPGRAACCCSTSCSATAPHPDPAAELGAGDRAAAPARRWSSRCVGTAGDPQGLRRARPSALRGGRRRRSTCPTPRAARRAVDLLGGGRR